MGGSESKYAGTLRGIDKWSKIGEVKDADLVQHKLDNRIGELRLIRIDPHYLPANELSIYNFRTNTQNSFVSVVAAELQRPSSQLMCGNEQYCRVITEWIPYRLQDLAQLSLPQSLYVLSESLKGYHECFEKVGLFEVNDSMIGINNQGFVKVWLNENFADNHPVSQKPVLKITTVGLHEANRKSQRSMVQNIIEVVQHKCENGNYPSDLKNRLNLRNTFFDSYYEIELYCLESGNNFIIPDRLLINKPMTGSNSLVYPQQPPPIPVTTSTILPTVIQTPYSPVMTNSMIPMYTTISPPPVTVFSSVYPQPVQPVPIDPYSSTHRQFYLSQPSFIQSAIPSFRSSNDHQIFQIPSNSQDIPSQLQSKLIIKPIDSMARKSNRNSYR